MKRGEKMKTKLINLILTATMALSSVAVLGNDDDI